MANRKYQWKQCATHYERTFLFCLLM